MAHLKTQSTTKNLTERGEWKWVLVKSLYEKGFAKLEIVNLFKFIDKMMSLNPELQQQLKTKVREYEKEREMPFLSTLEEMAIEEGIEKGIERGKEIAAKSSNKKSIVNLLQKRFGELPENLIEALNQIDDISVLENLLLETISVGSVEEFYELVKTNFVEPN